MSSAAALLKITHMFCCGWSVGFISYSLPDLKRKRNSPSCLQFDSSLLEWKAILLVACVRRWWNDGYVRKQYRHGGEVGSNLLEGKREKHGGRGRQLMRNFGKSALSHVAAFCEKIPVLSCAELKI